MFKPVQRNLLVKRILRAGFLFREIEEFESWPWIGNGRFS
jgi:hypothetical protein